MIYNIQKCFRARALQDFCYALVKTEMDTDFEDECKSIVERRHTLTDKLKKMAKDKPVELQPSPSKMQVGIILLRWWGGSNCDKFGKHNFLGG